MVSAYSPLSPGAEMQLLLTRLDSSNPRPLLQSCEVYIDDFCSLKSHLFGLLRMFPTVLDASLFRSGSHEEHLHFAQDLVKAFRDNSFVKLRNHGISTSVIEDLFAWVCPLNSLHTFWF